MIVWTRTIIAGTRTNDSNFGIDGSSSRTNKWFSFDAWFWKAKIDNSNIKIDGFEIIVVIVWELHNKFFLVNISHKEYDDSLSSLTLHQTHDNICPIISCDTDRILI